MALWLVAVLCGLVFAALPYAVIVRDGGRAAALLAALRAVSGTLVAALLLDAPLGRAAQVPPRVVLDASQSWTRADSGGFARALAIARRESADTLWLAGDSLRAAPDDPSPRDRTSDLAAAIERAAADGRPLVLVTDGVASPIAASRLAALPRGSRIVVPPASPAPDVAIESITVPATAASGDTVVVRVRLANGATDIAGARVDVRAGIATASRTSQRMAGWTSTEMVLAVRLPAEDGTAVVTAVVTAPRDAERRNDTLHALVRTARGVGAVFASTAPDVDGQAALAAVRGAAGRPVPGYLRLTPSLWRTAEGLEAVGEDSVRRALRNAPLVVLHGDTAALGGTTTLIGAGRPLVLAPGPPASGEAAAADEWYVARAGASPLAAALAGAVWDSLPPVALHGRAPRTSPGGWAALPARAARQGDEVPVVTATVSPRRVVVHATGLGEWAARGGGARAAHDALWGAIVDWATADAAATDRPALIASSIAAGDPVRLRLASAGSLAVSTARRGDAAGARTVTLTGGAGDTMLVASPDAPGVYDVRAGATVLPLVVRPPDELMPRRPTLVTRTVGERSPAGGAPSLRTYGLAYAAALLALCTEWLLRRRQGLR